MVKVELLNSELAVEECYRAVASPEVGAIDMFIGTVRNSTKGKRVSHLFFEAYPQMAVAEMTKIADYALAEWQL
ncbi:MAG: molybdenum cofactor biosynthesis protein MoaE, partial [Chitinophagia bacterium]|nr:molybdenum cofactor biosynthesis protein MoaE [Chitinophagia bacterium]